MKKAVRWSFMVFAIVMIISLAIAGKWWIIVGAFAIAWLLDWANEEK